MLTKRIMGISSLWVAFCMVGLISRPNLLMSETYVLMDYKCALFKCKNYPVPTTDSNCGPIDPSCEFSQSGGKVI